MVESVMDELVKARLEIVELVMVALVLAEVVII